MKKYIFGLIFSIFLIIPNTTLAKKITCSNNDYEAIIDISKDKLNIGESSYIIISSENEYLNIDYKNNSKDIITVNNEGIVTALKEGNAKINVTVNFDNSSCNVDLPIQVVSSDSSLKTLTLEEFDMTSIFKSDKFDYEINLPYNYEKINIIANTNSTSASVNGTGTLYLNEGANECNIVVTASDGTTSTYKITIIREDANDDATLNSLVVEGYILSPKFASDIYKYTLNVDKDVNEITIKGSTTYEYAKIKGVGVFALASGKNVFYVTVTAENGNELKYEIEVNKNNGSSRLKNLKVKDFELDRDFNSEEFIYYITINNDIKKLDILAETYDNEQIEIIGNENFSVGENEVIIRVTSADKTTTTYKIIVNKLSKEEEIKIEKNNKLSKILLIIFVISIIIMGSSIVIFLKKNFKKKFRIKKKRNKKK